MSSGTPLKKSEVLEQFFKDTATHTLTVLRDDGNYRHLRCQKPGTWCYGFDIITWPGYLAISGDMGELMFARSADMIEFFRVGEEHHIAGGGLYINASYWSEKCKASDGDRKEFVPEYFQAYVREQFAEHIADHTEDGGEPPEWKNELWADLDGCVIHAASEYDTMESAMRALHDYGNPKQFGGFDFGSDIGELASRFEQYTYHWIWRLYAISWAVRAYDAHKAAEAAPASAAVSE